MCGITGFSGSKNTFPDLLKLKYLLYVNAAERGLHATGIFTPKSGVIKKAVPAGEFIVSDSFKKGLKKDNIFIGHVRHATIGDKNDENAHPFEYGNIVGVHNGTLVNYFALKNKEAEEVAKELTVDSKLLVYKLNEASNNEEISKQFSILNDYTGAAAMLFYNKETKLMYAYRDKERPLFYGIEPETNNLYISSLFHALLAIEIPIDNIYQFEENHVYTIKDSIITSKILVRSPKRVEDFIDLKMYSSDSAAQHEIEKTDDYLGIKFKENKHSGIAAHLLRGIHLVGYNVKVERLYTSGIFNHNITKDNWYLVTATSSNRDKVFVINNNEEPDLISVGSIDNSRFIPVKGKYIVIMTDLSIMHKNTEVFIAKEDDIMLVMEHEPFTNIARCKSLFTNKVFTINTKFIRPAERLDIERFVEANQQLFDGSELGTTTNLQTTINFDDIEDNNVEIINEDDDNQTIEDVNGEAYIHLLNNIEEDIIGINTKLEAGADTELICKSIKTLLNELKEIKDIKYINSIFTNKICC